MHHKKFLLWILILCVFAITWILFRTFEIGNLDLQNLRRWTSLALNFYQASPLWSSFLFFSLYVVVAGFSLPGAAFLTILGGALFGTGTGFFLVSFASSLGASLACWISRTLLREQISRRFASIYSQIDPAFQKEGLFYLFAMRLNPLFPFFVVNAVFGLTRVRLRDFYWVSQLGMIPGTLVYVHAGTQLSQLNSLTGLISPSLLWSLALLGIVPWLAKKLVDYIRSRRFPRPRSFDYNVVVVGGGSAGLIASYLAASTKAKVALIEADKMGGDCLNTGCVPSKALISIAHQFHAARQSLQWAFNSALQSADTPPESQTLPESKTSSTPLLRADWQKIQAEIDRRRSSIEPHDSVERYTSLGVDCLKAKALILSPYEIQLGNRIIRTRKLILATGAQARIPSIEGLDSQHLLTSENIWSLEKLPQRLLVLGGGSIGCELAQAFRRLGSEVLLIEKNSSLIHSMDGRLGETLLQALKSEGVNVQLQSELLSCNEMQARIRTGSGSIWSWEFDKVLCALGRQARTQGFGLENLHLELTADGRIRVDSYQRTNVPDVYACGDVCNAAQFTHAASHSAFSAAFNSLFGNWFQTSWRALPSVLFTDPQIAHIGLQESEAQAKGIAYEKTLYNLDDFDRALAEGKTQGFVQVLTKPGQDQILGVSIAGHQAGEMLSEMSLALTHGLGLKAILKCIHPYPVWSEANKLLAGQWQKAHTPRWIFPLLQKFHQWRRR